MRISVRRAWVSLLKTDAFHGPARAPRRRLVARALCLHAAQARPRTSRLGARQTSTVNRKGDLLPEHAPAWRLPCVLPLFIHTRPKASMTPPRSARNQNRACFRGLCSLQSTTREALALRSASRHPGRSTLPREPCSLRRASGFSHEYLLLSPRSALAHVPARTAPGLRHFSPKRVCATSAYAREVSSKNIPPAARHRPSAKRPPFSRPIHSASQLLRTA